MSINVLFIGGAPRSGKTEAAKAFEKDDNVMVMETSQTMKITAHQYYGAVDDDSKPHPYDHYESCKDEPNLDFSGRTPREAYIHYSEDIIKPEYGNSFFGKGLANLILYYAPPTIFAKHKAISNFVVTGVGFDEEVKAIMSAITESFQSSSFSYLFLSKDEADYSNCSRSIVNLEHLPPVHYTNDGTIDELHDMVKRTAWFSD